MGEAQAVAGCVCFLEFQRAFRVMKHSALHHHARDGRYELGLRYSVYLPVGYDLERKYYNTLYLLHGAGDDEYGWPCKGWVQQILDEMEWDRSIVVMPLVFLRLCEMEGKYPPPRPEFEAFWFEELMPSIASQYRVRPDPSGRAIAGLSIGSELALDVALGGRGEFASVSCLSPVFRQAPQPPEALSAQALVRRWPLLGRSNALKLIHLVCADKDHLSRESSASLATALRELSSAGGAAFSCEIDLPGFHEWSIWRQGFKSFLSALKPIWNSEH